MKLKWAIVLVVAAIVAAIAPKVWRIISGHNYQADSHWTDYDSNNTSSIDHSQWQEIIDDYLITDDPSGVHLLDYEGLLEEDNEKLQSYINTLTSLDVRQYSQDEQFAYWVNLYNALTVQVVLDNYPIDSIKDIPGSAISSGPWDNKLLTIQGQEISLNDIEHRILRPIWQDYRIHFAVNCASIGCPNLAATAFTAKNHIQLLDEAAADYLQHPRAFSFVDDYLFLSSIFKWYQSDFGKDEKNMLKLIAQHISNSAREEMQTFEGNVQYGYDWSLNAYGPED